jgi:peptide/nickel transport system permease protein
MGGSASERRMKKTSWAALLFLLGLFLVSLGVSFFFEDAINTFDPAFSGVPLAPSAQHLFGTDEMGRDILLRCLVGAKISLFVGFIAVALSTCVGTFIGLISGFFGKTLDYILMRITEIFMAIPTLFLILSIQAILGPSLWHVIIVIGLTSWMGSARLVRAEVLSLKDRPFITAAHARGLPTLKVLLKHLFPHTLSPIIVSSILGMGGAILLESVLSFLGLGIQPPFASWGSMLENSLSWMQAAPWLAIAPGVFITATVLSINALGDEIRTRISR